jgi:hypothetical protein
MIGVLLASTSLFAAPQFVAADCPYTAGHYFAGGYQFLGSGASGIRGGIEWTNPAVCGNGLGNAFSLEGITLCDTSTCPHWVQVGWVKRLAEDTSPKMYCEYKFGTATVKQYWFTITSASHQYEWSYQNPDWNCYLDGVIKFGVNSSSAFLTGTALTSQGETNSNHSQIGRNAPSYLQLYTQTYRLGSSNWQFFNLTLKATTFPYGRSLGTSSYTLRNWTNAH